MWHRGKKTETSMEHKMKLSRFFIKTLLGASLAFSAQAQDKAAVGPSPDVEALKQQVQALEQRLQALEQQTTQSQSTVQVDEIDQKVRVLERKREIDQEAALAAAKTVPRLTIGSGGLSATSADS